MCTKLYHVCITVMFIWALQRWIRQVCAVCFCLSVRGGRRGSDCGLTSCRFITANNRDFTLSRVSCNSLLYSALSLLPWAECMLEVLNIMWLPFFNMWMVDATCECLLAQVATKCIGTSGCSCASCGCFGQIYFVNTACACFVPIVTVLCHTWLHLVTCRCLNATSCCYWQI